MEQLTALDAAFLEVEDADPHVSLALGAVSVMEGPVPRYDEFVTAFTLRAATIPRFRQVLRTHPLDLRPPEWADDPHFDLSRHLHRAALPHPGGDAELFETIAALMERRLDRERPLWDCWIIEGLSDDRWAVLVKLHHCVADGIAATQMMARFGDDDTGTFATDIAGTKGRASQSVHLAGINLNPLNWVREIGRGALAAEHAAIGVAELTAGLLRPARPSSLNGPLTTMRRYSAARVRLADLQTVSRAFHVTLNDVALAAITHSYRRVLLGRGERPGHDSLRTLVPVSVRTADHFAASDNRVSAMLPLLPVDEPDPVRQLLLVRERLTRAKASGQSEGGSVAVSAADSVPFAFSAWAVRLLARLPQRAVVGLATNVPGPRGRQRLLGRLVLEILPVPPIALQVRTGIAMVSYADALVFGITADYDTASDIGALAAGIEDGVAQLVAASHAPRGGRAPAPAG